VAKRFKFAISGSPFAAEAISGGSAASTTYRATLSIEEGLDSHSIAGVVVVAAVFAITEASDTLSAAGESTLVAVLAVTEAADTAATEGGPIVLGTEASTEQDDTLAAPVSVVVGADLDADEADDTLAARANYGSTLQLRGLSRYIFGISSAPISSHAFSSGRQLSNEGYAEENDTLAATAAIRSNAVLAVTEANDTAASASAVTGAALNVTEANDTVNAFAYDAGAFTRRARVARRETPPTMIARRPKPILAVRSAA
jgi:hypothetical protein